MRLNSRILLSCLAVSLFCVVYPIYVIRPFRMQGPRELQVALAVLQYRPVITAICAVIALMNFFGTWRRKLVAMAGVVLVIVLAVLARVNIYEQMFHPIERSSFTPAAQSKLDKDEKVIAVLVGGQARAYPIRGMSYHHLINDTVGSAAIVATY